MDTVAETSLPVLPVETPEFSADPDRFLEAARREHPWLARFSQGYVVHGYQACADLMADDRNLICGFGPVIDFYGVRGSMWARFMEEIVISQSGPAHARLRRKARRALTQRTASFEAELLSGRPVGASAGGASASRTDRPSSASSAAAASKQVDRKACRQAADSAAARAAARRWAAVEAEPEWGLDMGACARIFGFCWVAFRVKAHS